MRTLSEARTSWTDIATFTSLEEYKSKACRVRDDASLPSRSIYWKVFLQFQTGDRAEWPRRLESARSAYDSLQARFLTLAPRSYSDAVSRDPLSDNAPSLYTATGHDETLQAEIHQDVIRCMPELEFFRDEAIRQTMTNVLFVYSKLIPDLSYRQGMHELLAPILWTVHLDAIQDAVTANEQDQFICQLCDARYIEHDAFTLFNVVMQNAKSFYEPANHALHNSILARIDRIYTSDLARLDQRLATHLHGLELPPQIFLLRWIRLLFGREFSFDNLLPVWDVIFAESPDLELVDNICLVLLLQLRWELLEADHNTALTLLLQYPDMPFDLSPQQLAIDATFLQQDNSATTARTLIKKYTGKDPQSGGGVFKTTMLKISSEGESSRFSFTPPRISPQLAGNLETLLQDAAKTVYSRGETWGINKAVRDAVDEVRKGVHEISSLPTPQAPRLGPAPNARQSDRRIEALTSRNKSIAKTLQSACDELWDFQRQVVEKQTFDKETIKALSAAIARVQFAGVYLQDPSVPLGTEEMDNPTRVQGVEADEKGTTTQGHEGPNESASHAVVATPDRSRLTDGSFSWMLSQDESALSKPDSTTPRSSPRKPTPRRAKKVTLGESDLDNSSKEQDKFALFDQDEEDANLGESDTPKP